MSKQVDIAAVFGSEHEARIGSGELDRWRNSVIAELCRRELARAQETP